MSLTCSTECRAEQGARELQRELDRRWWVGIVFVGVSCVLAYAAYVSSAWFWVPSALAAWFGTYQTIYSKGCASCGAAGAIDTGSVPCLSDVQRRTRRRMAHRFLAATVAIAGVAAFILPVLWPLTAIVGWFAASFYVAAWRGYVGCPEIGAIPSWLFGTHIATRCAPLERKDARVAGVG